MAEMMAQVPSCAVAVFAHPDDADVACGGTLAHWAEAGSEVHLVVCTTGDKGSSDASVDPAELALRRAGELDRAAATLGLAGHRQLGHPDGELFDERRLIGELVGELRRLRPEVLLCPDPTAVFFGEHYYNHRDHRAVGWAALDAAAPAAAQPHYFPEAGPPHQVETVLLTGTITPDVWVDVSATIDRKVSAVMCHESQLSESSEWFATVLRRRAEDGGRQAGVRHAEGFRRLRLA